MLDKTGKNFHLCVYLNLYITSKQALRGVLAAGWEKGRRDCNFSVSKKSMQNVCKMLIGRDDISNVFQCLFTFALVSASG